MKVVFLETDDNNNEVEIKSVHDLNYPFVNSRKKSDFLIEKTDSEENK